MIGVTIGIGEGWEAAARVAAARMSEMTGLRCAVLTEDTLGTGAAHPSWLKCHVPELFPDENEFLVFDADIISLAYWDPVKLFASLWRPFIAVGEDNTDPLYRECRDYSLPFPDWYVNGGLTIFGREHREVWERVWAAHPNAGGRWLEQTPLNCALLAMAREGRVEVVRLPRRFNRLVHAQWGEVDRLAQTAVNLHLDSLGGDAGRLRELQRRFIFEEGAV